MGKDIEDSGERNAGVHWLAFCALGMVSSLALYGVALEYATSGGRKLHELSFVFVTTTVYAITAGFMKWLFGEASADIPKKHMLILSFTSLASSWTSVRSLRYVIYPVQVLFKSCKPVPVMAFGVALGKKYPLKKYVNVAIITMGVALFMGGGSSTRKEEDADGGDTGSDDSSGADTMLLGVLMLSVSLCFDGATGAYEDKLMGNDHIGPFDLMYNIQFGKAVISFCLLVSLNQLPQFFETLHEGHFTLILLGLTGAMGQVFVFVTISKFGALNCALIGLGRKILTLALSFYLYGHTMNGIQMIGLGVAISCMIFNFVDKGKGDKKSNSNSKVELADKKAQYAVEYSEEEFARPAAYHDDEPLLLDGGGGIPGGGIPGGGRVVDMALDDIHTPPRRVDLDLLDIMTPGEPTPSKTETV